LLAFSLPLAAAGTLAGHAAGYTLVGTSRDDALAHGYLAYAPQFLVVCVAAVAVALWLRVAGRLQGSQAAWPFALIPPVAFGGQELIERLAAGLPAHTVLEPAVWVGLAAQLPIAFVAFLVARGLLRVADEAARAIAPRSTFPLRPVPTAAPWTAPLPVPARLPCGPLGRAPPR
jgi:hypothetical protein